MTLGNFGVFYSCLKGSVRQSISDDLKLPNNYDGPGLLERTIFVLKDLRNAIAQNSAVYDVRFKRAKVGTVSLSRSWPATTTFCCGAPTNSAVSSTSSASAI